MKRLAVLVFAVVLACGGLLALSGCTPKAPENGITAIALLQKDQAGNEQFTIEIVQDDNGAQLTMTGPALGNANMVASIEKKNYATLQRALDKLDFDAWTSLSEGQAVVAPAGGFAVVVQRSDGAVLGSTSETLSDEVLGLISDQIADVVADHITDRLGIDTGIFGLFL